MRLTMHDIEQKELTRSEITQSALREFSYLKARVRQVHNIPVRRRQNHIEKGWPDIQGYSKDGIAILCEVKTKRDTLSKEQIERLTDAKKSGCICMIATVNQLGRFMLKEFVPVVLVILFSTNLFSQMQENDTHRRRIEYAGTVFRSGYPSILGDTMVKCRIAVLNSNTDSVIKVVRGFCKCARPEYGFNMPPFGVDGWAAVNEYNRYYRVVRVISLHNRDSSLIADNLVFSYKIQQW